MSAQGYRAVCSLCQTVLVSSMPHGRFESFEAAARVARAHVLHRCEKVTGTPKGRELDALADNSVEVVEGVA